MSIKYKPKFWLKSGVRKAASLWVFICLLTGIFFWLQAHAAQSESETRFFEAKVIRVVDGDTITVQDKHHQKIKIRLASIDAPELKQAFGLESKTYLHQLIYGKTVQVQVQVLESDPYQRTLANINSQGQDVQLQLIDNGMAWHYAYFAKKQQTAQEFKQYEHAQKQAQVNQLGLWKAPKAIAPWNFKRNARKQNKAKANY